MRARVPNSATTTDGQLLDIGTTSRDVGRPGPGRRTTTPLAALANPTMSHPPWVSRWARAVLIVVSTRYRRLLNLLRSDPASRDAVGASGRQHVAHGCTRYLLPHCPSTSTPWQLEGEQLAQHRQPREGETRRSAGKNSKYQRYPARPPKRPIPASIPGSRSPLQEMEGAAMSRPRSPSRSGASHAYPPVFCAFATTPYGSYHLLLPVRPPDRPMKDQSLLVRSTCVLPARGISDAALPRCTPYVRKKVPPALPFPSVRCSSASWLV